MFYESAFALQFLARATSSWVAQTTRRSLAKVVGIDSVSVNRPTRTMCLQR